MTEQPIVILFNRESAVVTYQRADGSTFKKRMTPKQGIKLQTGFNLKTASGKLVHYFVTQTHWGWSSEPMSADLLNRIG
jgi:hypothetical protein